MPWPSRTAPEAGLEAWSNGGALEETELLRVLSEQMDMPTVDLQRITTPERAPRDAAGRDGKLAPVRSDRDRRRVSTSAVADRLGEVKLRLREAPPGARFSSFSPRAMTSPGCSAR